MNPHKDTLPLLGKAVLWFFLNDDDYYQAIGDFEEAYRERMKRQGLVPAILWFWFLLFRSLPGFILDHLYWSLVMFKNYLKVAFRNFKRHKGFSFINVAGLSIGMACCILIMLWIQDELSYDKFHENRNNIYRVLRCSPENPENVSALSPNILAQVLKDEIPEVKATAKLGFQHNLVIIRDEKKYFEKGFLAEGDLFQIFSFPFIQGDPITALSKPGSIVITQRMAVRFFGNEIPVGKYLTLNMNKKIHLEVSGVLKNIPRNSHLQFDYVIPFNLMQRSDGDLKELWDDIGYGTYVELQDNSSVFEVERKINELVRRNKKNPRIYALQPLTRIHLYSADFSNDIIREHVHIKYLYIFSFTVVLILVIALINFMNLSSVLVQKRAKEIGIRKVIGARQKDVMKQFFLESCIVSFFAIACGFAVCLLFLPVFNRMTGKDLTYAFLGRGDILLGILGIILFIGFLSGAFPTLFLSPFHPINALKGTHARKSGRVVYRKILVAVQFAFPIFFIVVAAVMHNQLRYIKYKDLGFNKENLVCFRMYDKSGEKLETLKQDLLMSRSVLNVTFTEQLPSLMGGVYDSDWEGKNPGEDVRLNIIHVDPDYIATFNMQMKEGRFFSDEFGTDDNAFVLNEAAVQEMGMVSPIGKGFSSRRKKGTIIGIMDNFHSQSLRNRMRPVGLILMEPRRANFMVARIHPHYVSESMDFLEKTWKRIYPDFPFSYFFLDDVLDRSYQAEQKSGNLFLISSVLALFLACLGLFGLTSFMTEQRTKEIGIRKVLGASVPSIAGLLSKDFTKCLLLANIIAWPVAYYFMNKWLQNFAYRIDLSVWPFIISGLAALGFALITVSYHSVKAATANPVDSLRYE